MIAVENKILPVIKEHKSGIPVGITSVCSANSYVIKAAILNAKKNNKILLVESTSNQVDQFGGYTGMTPEDFKNFVFETADSLEFSTRNIILGGDHLGPNVWQSKPAAKAMENAKELVSSYIKAGYSKIHLDVSMKCNDDGDRRIPLEPAVIAERTAILCKSAEESLTQRDRELELPVYVIGTDVPPPGGAKDEDDFIIITAPEEVEETINLTRQSFRKYGLNDAWNRVIATVVQPGVEFGDNNVFDYTRSKSARLKKKIEEEENFVYEAHSTDYQLGDSLKKMVEDHFAILKVGPWLTYTFREALFALVMIEKELLSTRKDVNLSNLTDVIDTSMKKNPAYWEKYYASTEEHELHIKRKFSFSDRVRYYWNDSAVKDSIRKLFLNLTDYRIPVTLISQFLPESYEAVRNGEIKNLPESLVLNRIEQVLNKYNYATMEGI